MKIRLYTEVPPNVDIKTITSFGMPLQGRIDGTFYGIKDFQTKKKAINYLNDVAKTLSFNKDDLNRMKREIKTKNSLSYGNSIVNMKKINK